jgi:ABC-type transporter Mla subunit MlaD
MIVGLIALLFLGGDAHPLIAYVDVYQDRLENVVTDEGRLEQAKNVFKEFTDRTKARDKEVSETAKQLGKTIGAKNSTAAEIDAVWGQYYQDIDAYHSMMVDTRSELKQTLTRDEWQAIYGPPVTIN